MSKVNTLSRRSQRRLPFAISLLVFSGVQIASAQTGRLAENQLFAPEVTRRLDSQLERIMEENNLPSVEVEIRVPCKGRYSFVRGTADIAAGIARKRNEPFRIASITKPFGATAILVLVDEGRVCKRDTISKWYPDFPNADIITIDDLLRMRSGIPAPNDDEVLARVYDHPLAPAHSFDEEMKSYEKFAPNSSGQTLSASTPISTTTFWPRSSTESPVRTSALSSLRR